MRLFDNAHPSGRWLGDAPPLPGRRSLGEAGGACCRDGFARLSLIRPLWWERPERPERWQYTREVYLLCPRCIEIREGCGAAYDYEKGFNPHLAVAAWPAALGISAERMRQIFGEA